MLVSLINSIDAVNTVLMKMPRKERDDLDHFDVEEIAAIKDLTALLQSFEEATTETSGETFVTISKILPLARGTFKKRNFQVLRFR